MEDKALVFVLRDVAREYGEGFAGQARQAYENHCEASALEQQIAAISRR